MKFDYNQYFSCYFLAGPPSPLCTAIEGAYELVFLVVNASSKILTMLHLKLFFRTKRKHTTDVPKRLEDWNLIVFYECAIPERQTSSA